MNLIMKIGKNEEMLKIKYDLFNTQFIMLDLCFNYFNA